MHSIPAAEEDDDDVPLADDTGFNDDDTDTEPLRTVFAAALQKLNDEDVVAVVAEAATIGNVLEVGVAEDEEAIELDDEWPRERV